MPSCPNCRSELQERVLECYSCGALFGPESAWHPVDDSVSDSRSERCHPGVRVAANLVATCIITYGMFLAFACAVVLSVLSIPVGLNNSPVRTIVLLSLVTCLFRLPHLSSAGEFPPFIHLWW